MSSHFHFHVWAKWENTGEWELLTTQRSADDARRYVQDRVSTSGGRITRVEIREPRAETGECLFDKSWR